MGQPNSLLRVLKVEFGCDLQPDSLHRGLKAEFGCDLQPDSRFRFLNIDFGCRRETCSDGACHPSGGAYAPRP